MMDGNAPANDLVLPAGSSYHGSELYREPFRWDQRLHVIQLKFASGSHMNGGGAEKYGSRFSSGLSQMALSTGGTFATAASMNHLIRSVDALIAEHSSRRPPCVSIEFEPLEAPSSHGATSVPLGHTTSISSPQAPPNTVQRIQTRPPGGVWPFPEDFLVPLNASSLPSRRAIPRVWYKPTPVPHPRAHFGFPADVYDLDTATSPLAQWVIDHVPKGHVLECYASMDVNESLRSVSTSSTVTTPGESGSNSNGTAPFAFLAAYADNVKFVVQIYNYPALNALFAQYQTRTPKWKVDFEKFVSGLPAYYVGPLKATLKQINLPNTPLLNGHVAHPLNLILDTHVATCKELPAECAQWLADMKTRAQASRTALISDIANTRKLLLLSERTGSSSSSRAVTTRDEKIDRSQLLLQIDILRSRLSALKPSSTSELSLRHPDTRSHFDNTKTGRFDDEQAKHHVPISEMGDFQSYLAKKPPPLKSIDDSLTQIGKPYFGNPFTKGDASAFVDEVSVSGPSVNGAKKMKKRKRKFEIGERADKFKQFMTAENTPNGSPNGPSSPHSQSTPPMSPSLLHMSSSSSSPHGSSGGANSPFSSHPSSPSFSTSTTASPTHSAPSSPAHNFFEPTVASGASQTPHSTTPPMPAASSASPSASLNTSTLPKITAAQTFAQVQKTRKEQLQKWEKNAQPLAHPGPSHSGNGTTTSNSGNSSLGFMTPADSVSPRVTASIAPISPMMMLKHAQHNHSLTLKVLTALRRPNTPDVKVLKACIAELRGTPELKNRALQDWAALAKAHRLEASLFFNSMNL